MNDEQQKQEVEEKQVLAEQITIDGILFYHMPIDVSIKYSKKINSGFFVPLSSTKRIRIHFGDADVRSKLESYRDKGLNSILLAEDDYYSFLKTIKHSLIGFFVKDDDLSSETLNMDQIFLLVKKAIIYMGLSENIATVGEIVNRKVLQWAKTVPSINGAMKVFQRDNQDEFLKNLMVSCTSIALIDALNWSTPQIKEKISQICLLSDITLSANGFIDIIVSNGNPSKFTASTYNHPLDAGRMVSRTRNSVGREVIWAIEQHHELPDGSGYPKKIKGLAIGQLSAIQIVSRTFINKLIEFDFAYDDRRKFIDEMIQKFNFPNFAQPCNALYLIMGLEPSKQAGHFD